MLDVILKHAKHFVNEEHENAKARGINYYEDGSLFMSDGVAGVYAYNVHSDDAKVTTLSGKKLKNDGLSQNKALQLIKEPQDVADRSRAVCNVEVDELLKFVQTITSVCVEVDEDGKRKSIPLSFIYDDAGFSVSVHRSDFKGSYQDGEYKFLEPHKMGLDAVRLERALKLIKDIGYEDVKLYSGSLGMPAEFRSYDGLLRVIIMQLRLY